MPYICICHYCSFQGLGSSSSLLKRKVRKKSEDLKGGGACEDMALPGHGSLLGLKGRNEAKKYKIHPWLTLTKATPAPALSWPLAIFPLF